MIMFILNWPLTMRIFSYMFKPTSKTKTKGTQPRSLPLSTNENPQPRSLPLSTNENPQPRSLPLSTNENPQPRSLPLVVGDSHKSRRPGPLCSLGSGPGYPEAVAWSQAKVLH